MCLTPIVMDKSRSIVSKTYPTEKSFAFAFEITVPLPKHGTQI